MVAHWKGIDRNHGNAIVPMLIGDQGCGKTAFCGIILPEELRDYYNDKIDFKNDTAINLGLTSFALINIDTARLTSSAVAMPRSSPRPTICGLCLMTSRAPEGSSASWSKAPSTICRLWTMPNFMPNS